MWADISCNVTYNYGNCSKSFTPNSGNYSNVNGAIPVIPSLAQICSADSGCSSLASSCGIPSGATFNGWNCSNLGNESCNPGVSGNIYPDGTQMCKLDACPAVCTASITYPTYAVTYSCGSGASGSVSGGSVTYGNGYTFASASNCSNSGKIFDGWSCTSGVGDHDEDEHITWNYSTGTTCTAQWRNFCESPYVATQLSSSATLDPNANIKDSGYHNADGSELNSNSYNLNSGMWGITLDDDGVITGNAVCDKLSGDPTVPDHTSALNELEDLYCWCNATEYTPANDQAQPMLSDWVIAGVFVDKGACLSACAASCAQQITDSFDFRDAMYHNGMICDKGPETDCYITYDSNGTNNPNCATGTGSDPVYDNPYTVPAPEDISGITVSSGNCVFDGWYNESTGETYNPGEDIEIDMGDCKDLKFTAQWTEIETYPVTYNCGSGGTGTVPSGTAGAGQSFTFEGSSYCTNSGMVLDHWSCTNSVGDHAPGSSVTWNYATGTTCTAMWLKPVEYTVTYNCGLGSGTAPVDSNSPYSTGSNTTVTVKTNTCTALAHATFNGWSCNGVTRAPNSTFTISANTVCTALWQCGSGYTMEQIVLDNLYPGEEDNDPPVNLDANDDDHYGVRFSYGDVYVSGMCSNDGYGYNQLDSGMPTRVSNDTSGNYCWCKATKYRPGGDDTIYNLNTTSWILLDSGTNICNVGSAGNDSCLYMCGRAFAGNGGNIVVDIDDFRDALYAGQMCVLNVSISLSSQGASNHGSTQVYTKYQTGIYTDSARTQEMHVNTYSNANYSITTPTRNGYKFLGYYGANNCGGTKYIDESGYITAEGITDGIAYTSNTTWYACWTNQVTLWWDPGCEAANDCTAFTTTCTYGGTFTTPSAPAVDPTLSGIYTFGGWSESATSNTNYYNTNTTHNCTSADLFGYGPGDTVSFYGFWNCGSGYHRANINSPLNNLYSNNANTVQCTTTKESQSSTFRSENGCNLNSSQLSQLNDGDWVQQHSYGTVYGTSACEGPSVGGNYNCKCRITGYTDSNNVVHDVSMLHNMDIYMGHTTCTTTCASICAEANIGNYTLGSVAGNEVTVFYATYLNYYKDNSCRPNTFNVQYAGNGNTGGNAPSAPTSCTYNGTCNAPANTYTKTGWTFTGWTCTSSSGSCASATYAVGADISTATSVNGATITLTAQWEQDVYIISLDDVDGSGGDREVKEIYGVKWLDVNDNDIDQVSIPELEDSVFAGYYTDPVTGTRKIGSDGSLPSNTTFSSDTTLYAHFEKCSCTPGAHVANCDVGDPVVRDNRCNFKYSCDDGYDFQQNEDGTFTGAVGVGDNTSPACVAVCNTITLNRNGGSGGTSSLYKLTDNARWFSDNQCSDRVTKIPSAPTKNGYTYNGHYNSANGSTNYIASDGTLDASWTVNQNTTIYAQWTGNTLNFEWDSNDGTPSEIDTPATCTYGATAGNTGGLNDIAQPTKTGYDFAGWVLTNWSAGNNGG